MRLQPGSRLLNSRSGWRENRRGKNADDLFEDGFTNMLSILLFCPLTGWLLSQVTARNSTATILIGFVGVSVAAGVVAFRAMRKIKLAS